MRGDKLNIREGHRQAAAQLFPIVLRRLESHSGCLAATIAGESGAGKSEIACVLGGLLEHTGVRTVLLQQDDYFVYPPLTNAARRRASLQHVGVSEVRLDALDRSIHEIMGGAKVISKPLVIYEEDRITEETIDTAGARVVIAEGTYTTLLPSAGLRVFIDRSYHETMNDRRARGREVQDEHLQQVLELEHAIISRHKDLADVIVGGDWSVLERTRRTGAPAHIGSCHADMADDVRGGESGEQN